MNMITKVKILLLIFLISFPIGAQQTERVPDKIKLFFSEMIDSSNADLSKFVDIESLELSKRLDIHYAGVKNKFLLSYEIDPNIIA